MQTTADPNIKVNVDSVYMEDYHTMVPYTISDDTNISAYTSRNNTRNLIQFSRIPLSGNGVFSLNTERVYEDADATTGWSIDRQTISLNTSTPVTLVKSVINTTHFKVVLFTDQNIYAADMNDDGSLSSFTLKGSFDQKILTNWEWPDKWNGNYIPFFLMENGKYNVFLLDVITFTTYATNDQSFGAFLYPQGESYIHILESNQSDLFQYIGYDSDRDKTWFFEETLQLNPHTNTFVSITKTTLLEIENGGLIEYDRGFNLTCSQNGNNIDLVVFKISLGLLFKISGKMDNGSGNTIVWQPLTSWELDANSMQFFSTKTTDSLTMLLKPNGINASLLDLYISCTGQNAILLRSTYDPDNQLWQPLSPAADMNFGRQYGEIMSFNTAEFSALLLNYNSSVGAYMTATISENEQGSLETATIDLPADEDTYEMQPSYRNVITFSKDNMPMGATRVNINATSTCRVVINGEYALIGPAAPLQTFTNSNGDILLTVLANNTLKAPDLIIGSDVLADKLVIKMGDKTEQYLSAITPESLSAAKDPITGIPLLSDPSKAGDVANSIKEVMKMAPPSLVPAMMLNTKNISGTGKCFWIPANHAYSKPRSTTASAGASPWKIDIENGFLFSTITHEEHAATISRLSTSHQPFSVLKPMGIFDDIGDFFDDVANYLADKVASVTTIISDGFNITLTLVINGLSYIYHGIIDTIDKVLDTIDFILEQAGVIIGTFLNWLLTQLGFLFDWSAIKSTRDALKSGFRNNLVALQSKITDPAVTLQKLAASLDSKKQDVISGIQQFLNSNPGNNFANTAETAPSLLSVMSTANGVSIMPQATWLIEKVESAIGLKSIFSIGMPNIPGLDGIMQKFALQLDSGASLINTLVNDLTSLVQTWANNLDNLAATTYNTLCGLITKWINQLFDFFKSVLLSLGDVLHALWSNPTQVADWLDTKIKIPFFGGLYKGLTGNDLSILDLCCMLSAIPAYIIFGPQQSAISELAASTVSASKIAAITMYSASAVVGGFEIAASYMDDGGPFREKLSLLSGCLNLGATVAVITDDYSDGWLYGSYAGLAVIVGFLYSGILSDSKRRTAVDVLSTMPFLLSIAEYAAKGKKENNKLFFNALGVMQVGISIFARKMSPSSNYYAAVGTGGLYSIVGGTKTGIYGWQPL